MHRRRILKGLERSSWELRNFPARSFFQEDPTLRGCRSASKLNRKRTTETKEERFPKGKRMRKFQPASCHIVEHSVNTIEERACKVGTRLILKVQENQFHMKPRDRKVVRSSPIQSSSKIKESKKQNSTPKESVLERQGFGTIHNCKLPSRQAKIR